MSEQVSPAIIKQLSCGCPLPVPDGIIEVCCTELTIDNELVFTYDDQHGCVCGAVSVGQTVSVVYSDVGSRTNESRWESVGQPRNYLFRLSDGRVLLTGVYICTEYSMDGPRFVPPVDYSRVPIRYKRPEWP